MNLAISFESTVRSSKWESYKFIWSNWEVFNFSNDDLQECFDFLITLVKNHANKCFDEKPIIH